MDVIPQLDLKLSDARWSKYSEGPLQTSPTAKKEVAINILPLVDTNGSVKELTLFLPGLTLLQLPRIKYSDS
jgi:hypothetical protein